MKKLFSTPTAQDKERRDLHLAELESLIAAANLEHAIATKSMLDTRVARLRQFTQGDQS
jgi:hypothetical protein